ncbi:hypothetical protein D3C73_812360 [compost metagenome]
MEYVSSVFLSSLEFLSIILLMFTIFNLSFKRFYLYTVFICLFLANVSHYLRNSGLEEQKLLSVSIQMILFVILVWLLYRINILWAIVVAIIGYASYIVIQLCIFYILLMTGFMTAEELVPNTEKYYTLQFLSILAPLIISHFLKTVNWHLNFIPTKKYLKLKLKNENLILILVSIVTFLVSGILYYSISVGQTTIFFTTSVLQLLTISILLYYSVRKEINNDY